MPEKPGRRKPGPGFCAKWRGRAAGEKRGVRVMHKKIFEIDSIDVTPPIHYIVFATPHKNEIPSPKKASLPRWPFYFSGNMAEKTGDILFFLCNI